MTTERNDLAAPILYIPSITHSQPFFTIITPTLQRPSLLTCCQSLDNQSFRSWEHLIFVDAETISDETTSMVNGHQRHVLCNHIRHNDFGNTPRRLAWTNAKGSYCIYLDDDNYLTTPDSLANIYDRLQSTTPPFPSWGIFPILRFNNIFCDPSPGVCHTDSANMVIRRDLAQWPDMRDYTADGHLAASLVASCPDFLVAAGCPPIITVPVQSKGE